VKGEALLSCLAWGEACASRKFNGEREVLKLFCRACRVISRSLLLFAGSDFRWALAVTLHDGYQARTPAKKGIRSAVLF